MRDCPAPPLSLGSARMFDGLLTGRACRVGSRAAPRTFAEAVRAALALGLLRLHRSPRCAAPVTRSRRTRRPGAVDPPPPTRCPATAPARTGAPTRADRRRRSRSALLLPLSGPNADLGKAMLEAAQMALFETGGDTADPGAARQRGHGEGAAVRRRAAIAEGATVILGPLLAAEVER